MCNITNHEGNGNQEHIKFYLTPIRIAATVKKTKKNWTWNNRLVPNQERIMSSIVTLII